MDKRFWAILGVIAVVFVGIVWVNNHNKDDKTNTNTTGGQTTNHIEGAKNSGITLVEYGDYQCPVCGLYYPTVKEVTEKYKKDIAFQFRNFPLTQVHPNAFAGSRAAEAADKQGKFWEMHDQLYLNQNTWTPASDPLKYFQSYAQQIGINVDQFKKDFTSDSVNKSINADIAAGNKLGITGTPAFFLNGKPVALKDLIDPTNNSPSTERFSQVIDKAIAEAKKK